MHDFKDLIAVNCTAPSIEDKLDALKAHVVEQVAIYDGATIDPEDDEQVKAARKACAALNDIRKPIDAEFRRVKGEYLAPLNAFKARVDEITALVDTSRAAIKAQVDEADALFRERRREHLEEEWRGVAGALAELVPFETVLDAKWLNRSTAVTKAEKEVQDAAERINADYAALSLQNLDHRAEAMAEFARTLSVSCALGENQRLIDLERQRAEEAERAAMAEAAMREIKAEREEPKPKEKPRIWTLNAEFVGTSEDARNVAETLKALGVSGKIEPKE